MLMRPPSRPLIAILKPAPSSPMRLDSGTRTWSSMTAVVGWAFQPSLFSIFPKLRPSMPCTGKRSPRWDAWSGVGRRSCLPAHQRI